MPLPVVVEEEEVGLGEAEVGLGEAEAVAEREGLGVSPPVTAAEERALVSADVVCSSPVVLSASVCCSVVVTASSTGGELGSGWVSTRSSEPLAAPLRKPWARATTQITITTRHAAATAIICPRFFFSLK